MEQKVSGTVVCNALYLLFGEIYENMVESKEWRVDQNDNVDYRHSFRMYYKATDKEDTIRKLWGSRCQKLLSGILIYLYKLDRYFSPKLNTCEQFFIKLYRHREILAKIGCAEHKIVFPFEKLIEKNKPLLIRC